MTLKKLCVFPNDPLNAYYEKGEIKENYFNPNNYFDEIHCISTVPNDIDVSKVQKLAGDAKFEIHSVGKINVRNYKNEIKNVLNLVKKINPDIIRAFNPLIEGWLAAKCAKELGIPFLVSLHTQYKFNRMKLKTSNLKKYLVFKYTEIFIEPFVLQSADKILIVYEIIESYVKKYTRTKPEVLYNKVDRNMFLPNDNPKELKRPSIISVGNLSEIKNHQCLIKAMKHIDADLLLIGRGELYDELQKLIKNHNLHEKVNIKTSVPHEKMPDYYRAAQIFALAYDPEVESIPMPVMEAMACGLPIVIPQAKEGFLTGLENVSITAKRTPRSFAEKINQLIDDQDAIKKYSKKVQEEAKKFDSKGIEERESQIYAELVEKRIRRIG